MKQLPALVYKLRKQSSRLGAVLFHLFTLALPVGLIAASYFMQQYAQKHLQWAVKMTSGFMEGYLGGSGTSTKEELLALLSSTLDAAMIWSFLIVFLFTLPVHTSTFVNDRVEGLRDLLSSMGLSRFVYWVGNGLFNLMLLLGNISVLVLGLCSCSSPPSTQSPDPLFWINVEVASIWTFLC